jgi:Domain of unknown function DUF29
MAKVIARPPASDLYQDDFALWAERQAALLRAGRFDALDLESLIEEVEDLGRRERDMVESHIETILEHLLKLALSHADRLRYAACHLFRVLCLSSGPKTPGYPFRPPGKERGDRTLARPPTASNSPTRPLPQAASGHAEPKP